ncbi:MAG: helix-turn-helix domain-containing protein [Candidatus Omnitrophica bacterium]|nr:helix-turn-helix domain-containing protein [Candidatus Omnitrophota bacterium]
MRIGEQLKKLREEKKMSLTELAQSSGVQIATLSRIENNKMTGTLDSHMAISKALNIDVTELYQTPLQEEPVSIRQENIADEPLTASDGKTSQEILARQVTSKRMMPALIKLEPKSATKTDQFPAGAERFIYVLEGAVDIKLKSKTIHIASNTSLYFNAAQPHNIENNDNRVARILSVTTPVAI